tara:strand:+ start:340 stop:591 length:252 start_codon:yes stop_codon:yes gene_type:complete
MIQFHRLLESSLGKILISILLGLGLASLFHKVCNEKYCIQFNGPVIREIDGKIQQYGDSCYKYEMIHTKCDENKKIIPLKNSE